jgi:hypothetical protein
MFFTITGFWKLKGMGYKIGLTTPRRLRMERRKLTVQGSAEVGFDFCVEYLPSRHSEKTGRILQHSKVDDVQQLIDAIHGHIVCRADDMVLEVDDQTQWQYARVALSRKRAVAVVQKNIEAGKLEMRLFLNCRPVTEPYEKFHSGALCADLSAKRFFRRLGIRQSEVEIVDVSADPSQLVWDVG